ncbi:hypothetical protein GQ43DRAFT_437193 [Delitschia confertaspora ATCC 74209]|uniref:Uncharacterized protein n=1 Tax=Delitschia confertaspora ATCC 74209 TaxID=1513339 RepID=A0A9P4JTH3_9PLEO|nr:hypothetical protein GQ43DRAFT_437193 [Delitschia confertaspora ATCC 74209]
MPSTYPPPPTKFLSPPPPSPHLQAHLKGTPSNHPYITSLVFDHPYRQGSENKRGRSRGIQCDYSYRALMAHFIAKGALSGRLYKSLNQCHSVPSKRLPSV